MTAPERRIRCNVFLTKTEAEGLRKMLACSVIMSEEKQATGTQVSSEELATHELIHKIGARLIASSNMMRRMEEELDEARSLFMLLLERSAKAQGQDK